MGRAKLKFFRNLPSSFLKIAFLGGLCLLLNLPKMRKSLKGEGFGGEQTFLFWIKIKSGKV